MSAQDNLSSYQFTSISKTWKKSPTLVAGITKAKRGNRIVGAIKWSGNKGMMVEDFNGAVVNYVHVNKDHRRKGVATKLWQEAQKEVAKHGIELTHSMNQSSEGKAWISSL